MENSRGIILFDGVCNLCNKGVDFIIKRDKNRYFYYTSLQSEKGQELKRKYQISEQTDSMILIEGDCAFTHADAILRIVRNLPLRWRIFLVAYLIPPTWRNRLYQFIARHRFRFFGKKDSCRLPTPEERAQFL
ncbi:thiol-disulfide oxidoreductase DCC family protein [Alkalicoccobacillus plakortidis]|uniref:DCC1-like thiol-disulfide oxidoreductase family protein n=1 Tax=Alkalicoccobacillus plakortidis TaxID=444060 RepID=A0ABT0XLL2_9BACI|nr:DCC1-like thiol-disulfide oxidoreductase family protein [Alkalicoccobacillus plakortidis]MCM2676802.1 DCC1-like thiol-disulfide oxidoreductase family protein [Alkalicoccobacillus plakortidis]